MNSLPETVQRIRKRKEELGQSLGLHPPGRVARVLEAVGLREVEPRDVCGQVEELVRVYPGLRGDQGAVGRSDFEGACQSYRHNPGWWRDLLQEHGVPVERSRQVRRR